MLYTYASAYTYFGESVKLKRYIYHKTESAFDSINYNVSIILRFINFSIYGLQVLLAQPLLQSILHILHVTESFQVLLNGSLMLLQLYYAN